MVFFSLFKNGFKLLLITVKARNCYPAFFHACTSLTNEVHA